MLSRLQREVEAAIRRTAFGMAGFVCLAIGLAFFTVAAWICLVQMSGPAVAALIIGAVYAGTGFILIALGARRPKPPPPVVPEPAPMPDLAGAFAQGLGRGMALRDQFDKARK